MPTPYHKGDRVQTNAAWDNRPHRPKSASRHDGMLCGVVAHEPSTECGVYGILWDGWDRVEYVGGRYLEREPAKRN